MALFQTKSQGVSHSVTHDDSIAALIQRRRYQLLVHSLIYYELDANLISDDQWSFWAKELVKLQNKHPDISDKVIFAEAFRDFDGSSGYDLPYRDEQIINIAYRLLRCSDTGDSIRALNELRNVEPMPAEYKGYHTTPAKQNTQRRAVVKNEPTKRKKLF